MNWGIGSPTGSMRWALCTVLLALTVVAGCTSNRSPSGSSVPSPESPDDVSRIISGLPWGRIAFNAPSRMDYKQRRIVEVVVAQTLSEKELENQLKQRAGAKSDRIRLAGRMAAVMTADGLDVKPLSSETQAVESRNPTRWRWLVTAAHGGTGQLHLRLNAFVKVDGQDVPREVQTYDRQIVVKVTGAQRASEFLGQNWSTLLSYILPSGVGLAAAIGVYKWWVSKKSARDNMASDDLD